MSDEHRQKYFPKKEKLINLYKFYDVKDREDCLKKTLILSSYGGIAGTGYGLASGILSITPGKREMFSAIVARVGKYGLPMFAAGGVYAGTTCAVSALRGGKDSPFNHFCAGLATGSVFGAAFTSQKVGYGVGFALALAGYLLKAGHIEGFMRINADRHRRQVGTPYPPRGWLCTRPDPDGDQVTDA